MLSNENYFVLSKGWNTISVCLKTHYEFLKRDVGAKITIFFFLSENQKAQDQIQFGLKNHVLAMDLMGLFSKGMDWQKAWFSAGLPNGPKMYTSFSPINNGSHHKFNCWDLSSMWEKWVRIYCTTRVLNNHSLSKIPREYK